MKKLQFLFLLCFISTTILAQHTDEVPNSVKKKFIKQHSKATDIEWEVDEISVATNHIDVFIVEYTENDKDITKLFDVNENLIETRTKIKQADLQGKINDSLEVHYPGLTIFTIQKIEKVKEKPFYQMMIKHDEGNYFLKVNLKGIILLERKN